MSEQIKDGGPAFPWPHTQYPNGEVEWGLPGMTLRDWFAGQALAGLMAAPECAAMGQEDIAHSAWSMADAMLAARKEQS